MPIADPAGSLRIAGRLCKDPTDLGIAYPHGGDDLGIVSNIVFRRSMVGRDMRSEAKGNQVVERIEGAESPLLLVNLVGFNDLMTSFFFIQTATGSSSGDTVIQRTSAVTAGGKASVRAAALLFSPRDTTNHPGLLVFNAMPMEEETAELRLSISEDLGFPAIWRAVEDATGRQYQFMKLEDMTL